MPPISDVATSSTAPVAAAERLFEGVEPPTKRGSRTRGERPCPRSRAYLTHTITACGRRQSVVIDLIRPGRPLSQAPRKKVHLRSCGKDDEELTPPASTVCLYTQTTPIPHAREPHPRQLHLASRVLCRCVVPQASIFTRGEGCARRSWVLREMVDIWDTFVLSCARTSHGFLHVEVAVGSDSVATVERVNAAREAA